MDRDSVDRLVTAASWTKSSLANTEYRQAAEKFIRKLNMKILIGLKYLLRAINVGFQHARIPVELGKNYVLV